MKSDMVFHDPEHKFEKSFWGDCTNTYGEEMKQFVYARHMGLDVINHQIDARNRSVLDVGGGPVSMLLKAVRLGTAVVADPIRYPDWTYHRYKAKNIVPMSTKGEDINMFWNKAFDEAWIYNVLQHVEDPAKVLMNAFRCARIVRIFEWLDFEPHPGHPHMLTDQFMDDITSSMSMTNHKGIKVFGEDGCHGRAYFGCFTSLTT